MSIGLGKSVGEIWLAEAWNNWSGSCLCIGTQSWSQNKSCGCYSLAQTKTVVNLLNSGCTVVTLHVFVLTLSGSSKLNGLFRHFSEQRWVVCQHPLCFIKEDAWYEPDHLSSVILPPGGFSFMCRWGSHLEMPFSIRGNAVWLNCMRVMLHGKQAMFFATPRVWMGVIWKLLCKSVNWELE